MARCFAKPNHHEDFLKKCSLCKESVDLSNGHKAVVLITVIKILS